MEKRGPESSSEIDIGRAVRWAGGMEGFRRLLSTPGRGAARPPPSHGKIWADGAAGASAALRGQVRRESSRIADSDAGGDAGIVISGIRSEATAAGKWTGSLPCALVFDLTNQQCFTLVCGVFVS